MHASSGARGDVRGVDLRGLDRLVAEVHELSGVPDQDQRLIHALRNLAHVASLLADVVKNDARAPRSSRGSDRPKGSPSE
jgi:hypothetical protein